MHELGLARNVVAIAEEHARAAGARSVRAIGLRVGALSGVDPEALRSAFELARLGTPLEDARLELETIPLACHCTDCGIGFTVQDRFGIALCPSCGRPSGDVRAGRELEVEYLEVV